MIEYVENGDLALVDGLKFRRDKRTGYYLNRKNQVRLHRYIWEKYNGAIAPGFHIHHIDFNKQNNDISNLSILSAKEHEMLHAEMQTEELRQKKRDNLTANARPKASEWHGSQEGREWHKQQYQKTKDVLHKEMVFNCTYCGKEYRAKNNGQNKFCSNNCKSAYRRKLGIDNIERLCSECGEPFTVNKYSKVERCESCRGKKHRALRG